MQVNQTIARTSGAASSLIPANADFRAVDIAPHIADLERDGFTIIEDLATDSFREEVTGVVNQVMARKGAQNMNEFVGTLTERVAGLLPEDPIFERMVMCRPVLEISKALLGEDPLLTSLMTMTLKPGAPAQAIHVDDIYQYVGIPRPFAPPAVTAILAITDFTKENGATHVIPGSQLRTTLPASSIEEAALQAGKIDYDTVRLTMKRGSLAMWTSSVWHGAGRNDTNVSRTGLNYGFNVGWVRPYENFTLSLPLDLVSRYSPELQGMLGYGCYRGVYNVIEGRDPREVLFPQSGRNA